MNTFVQGHVKTQAGTVGTVTLLAGDTILQIIVVGGAGATMALPNGTGGTATVPIPSSTPWTLCEQHAARIMGTPQGGLTIVFTSTTSYFVEYYSAQ